MDHRRGRRPTKPLYVGELFNLLEFIGVEWQTVQQDLGAPRTPFALWRHGRRPIAKAYAAPLIRYVIDAVNKALARAKAEDVRTDKGTILSKTSTAINFQWKVRDFVEMWARELMRTTGEHTRQIHQWIEVLWELNRQDADKQTSFELERGFYATKQLYAHYQGVMYARGMEDELAALEGFRRSGFNHDLSQSPAERLAVLARWVGILVDEPEA